MCRLIECIALSKIPLQSSTPATSTSTPTSATTPSSSTGRATSTISAAKRAALGGNTSSNSSNVGKSVAFILQESLDENLKHPNEDIQVSLLLQTNKQAINHSRNTNTNTL